MNTHLLNIQKDTVLRRYISIQNFERMLESGSIYFNRFDRYEDKLEGGITNNNFTSISNALEVFDITINGQLKTNEPMLEKLKKSEFPSIFGNQKRDNGDSFLSNISTWLYASCWTDLQHECQAMWRLYGKNEERCLHSENCEKCATTYNTSVCIETTLGDLLENFEPNGDYNLAVQKINYIDHKNFKFDGNDLVFQPFFSKARHFSYENEVRFILWPTRENIVFSYKHGQSTVNPDISASIKIKSFNSVIKKITLSPRPTWITEKIRHDYLERHGSILGLQGELYNSDLREKVAALCSKHNISSDIVESDLNQLSATDLYTLAEAMESNPETP